MIFLQAPPYQPVDVAISNYYRPPEVQLVQMAYSPKPPKPTKKTYTPKDRSLSNVAYVPEDSGVNNPLYRIEDQPEQADSKYREYDSIHANIQVLHVREIRPMKRKRKIVLCNKLNQTLRFHLQRFICC